MRPDGTLVRPAKSHIVFSSVWVQNSVAGFRLPFHARTFATVAVTLTRIRHSWVKGSKRPKVVSSEGLLLGRLSVSRHIPRKKRGADNHEHILLYHFCQLFQHFTCFANKSERSAHDRGNVSFVRHLPINEHRERIWHVVVLVFAHHRICC